MNREIYRYILSTYGRRPSIWFAFLCEVIRTFIIRVYVVIILAQLATSLASRNVVHAKHQLFYFLIVYIIGSIFGTVGDLVSNRTENIVYGELMVNYHAKLINKDMSFFRDNQTGYLASVFRQYLDSILQLVRFFRGEALAATISLIVPAVVLLFADVQIGLIIVGVLAVQVFYIIWSSAKANKYRHAAHQVYREITGEVSDEVTNIVAFKSGSAEQKAYVEMEALAAREVEAFWLRQKTTKLLDLPRGIITAFGISAAVYLIISESTTNNPKALGLIVLTLTYMFQIIRNVAVLPELIASHDDLITKLHPTLQYLSDDYELIRDPELPLNLTIKDAAVNLQNVTFSYPSNSKKGGRIMIFEDFNLHIKGGEQIGIVGLSGAGKSTLANLLLRFDDVDSGSITIDDIDIRDVAQTELRRKIAYVPQEPLLFHRSIKENIAYYDAEATENEIVRSAKAAHAHEFIEKLPDGYDTTVGERGVKLSGGQKQRIAIARAILKQAPIMVLDEATSALDSESEQIIQQALPQIISKQTAIVVAHRLSTVAKLDRIIVMHNGQIIEQGTHAELLKQKGRYYSLWQKQTSTTK